MLQHEIARLLGLGDPVINLEGTFETGARFGNVPYRWNLAKDHAELMDTSSGTWRRSDIAFRSSFEDEVLPGNSDFPDIERLRETLRALFRAGRIPPRVPRLPS